MHKELIWSPLAKQDLKELLDYLYDYWNEKIAIHFLKKIDLATNQITTHP